MNNLLTVLCALAMVLAAGVSYGDPAVHLELCYATSVNMPESEYGPENVFDNDTTTCWATMPGAAPDEGLYFSFEEPVDIRSIIVSTVPGSDEFEEIEYYQLYINGIEGADWHSGGSPVWIDSPVKTVFIRIDHTVTMEWGGDGMNYTGDLPVGISEVVLLVTDDEGNGVPLRIMPVREVGGTVEASSSLEPVEAYCTDFLFDSRPAFGWADGNVDDSGPGESLTFHFDQPQRIEKIKIWNGYHRSESHYIQNERIKAFSIGSSGEDSPVYRLEDSMEPHVITLETPLEGRSLTLDVLDVYESGVYRDLVVSELRFFDGEEWFVIDSGGSDARKLAVLQWARGNPAGSFIDKQLCLNHSSEEEWDWYSQTLVIRSNGSFVLWKTHEDSDGEEKVYADGNWQILGDDALRIFGRLQRVGRYGMDPYDPYAGSWPDQGQDVERMTIFSDTLHFEEGRVSSARGLFEDFTF
ncbi:MAG: hypothetical protein JXR55_00830 [Candidatus Fermentibacteraceae bacterium]|nr:hypothetical protein [Candidatus Fermentibacteraceae bacterium]